ncbi:MAG TPA: DUF1648 domain-containing protein [Blastocatellia bacterium]
MDIPDIVQAFLLIAAGAQTIYYYNVLPATVVSHFSASGAPNGWSPKLSLFVLYGIVMTVAIVISTVVPLLVQVLPPSMINLPNKDYWLSDEKRPETIRVFRRYFRWFGVMLMALLVAVFQVVFQANLVSVPPSPMVFWVLLGTFIAATLIWAIRFSIRFNRTD